MGTTSQLHSDPPCPKMGGDKLLGNIVLSMGHHIFLEGNLRLGFVTPHRDIEALLTNFFGSVDPPIDDRTPPTMCLREAVEALLRRQPNEVGSGKRGPSRIPRREDPVQLGRRTREQGWWPRLKHYVSILTATKAVGPTQGLTVYVNTKYSDFMGDIPGGQDRATSALSRSLGVMVIVPTPDPRHVAKLANASRPPCLAQAV